MQEVSVLPWWFTPALAIWAALGPLLGIWLGHQLLRSQQRKQWIVDHRIEEWRELLAVLSNSFMMTEQIRKEIETPALKLEKLKANLAARRKAGDVLLTRLFIAKEMGELKVHESWTKLLQQYDTDQDAKQFGAQFGEITRAIREKARTDIENI